MKFLINNSLSKRMVLYVVIISLTSILIATFFNIYIDYKNEVAKIENSLDYISDSYVPVIATSVFQYDNEIQQLLLNGALKLPGIEALTVKNKAGVILGEVGNSDFHKYKMVRSYDLTHSFSGIKTIKLGSLDVEVSFDDIYKDLFKKALMSLIIYTIAISLIAICITIITHLVVIRHLKGLALYADNIELLSLDKKLVLDRPGIYQDELQLLVNAVNDMQKRLKVGVEEKDKEMNERKLAELKLDKYKEQLESLVQKRTKELSLSNSQLLIIKERAETANKAKSEFLANMSHEIRTPMNSVLGFTEILQSLEKDSKKSHYLDNIYSSAKNLLSIINDILDLSKIEAGKLSLQYSTVSLEMIFNDLKAIFEKKITDKGLELIFEVDESVPNTLILDQMHISQILINLIGNSLKFTDSGHISIAASACNGNPSSRSRVELTLTVADTGIGIPEKQYKKIFDAFSQVKGQSAVKFGGTGLGLTICSRLINQMGGDISVESVVGKGSTFTIILHGVEIAAVEALKKTKEGQFDLKKISFEPATILIADDIDFNREMLTVYLESFGFNFIYAENGREALEQAEEHHPDLILLDMKMPEMDGYEAANALKSDKNLKEIPIIAVTASALKQDEETISKLCDGYLRKPVSQVDLVRDLMKFLPHS